MSKDIVTVATSGSRIAVRTGGVADAPALVFVHGWAQSARVWDEQFADPELARRFRLLAPDLRGHGGSEALSDDPREWAADTAAWADDLAAVLALAGPGAVLVGWSYGGLAITDYLRVHGTGAVAGVVYVGAITEIGRGRRGGAVGPAMAAALPHVLSEDFDVAVPALRDLSAAMTASPVPGALAQRLLGASLSVPPSVRAALFTRDVDSAEVLARVDVPALVIHGTEDRIVDIGAGEYTAGKIPGVSTRWWAGVGHLPFVESAREFDTTLRRFAEQAPDGRAEG